MNTENQCVVGREYLTRSEVAELFGVNVRTVTRSNMPCIRFGRAVRYSRAAVVAWAEQGGMKKTLQEN